MGSDGIFDKLSNEEVSECVWMSVRDVNRESNLESSHPMINVHKQIGMGVEYVIKNALLRRSLDNVTVVVIAFESFQKKISGTSI
jgi:serine/threonine protein phosphatase PrpC